MIQRFDRGCAARVSGRAVDIKQVGRELGVRYVLEGSIRKAGNRVRIVGQLVEAGNGRHIWADQGALIQRIARSRHSGMSAAPVPASLL
jgi:TolB-like protein